MFSLKSENKFYMKKFQFFFTDVRDRVDVINFLVSKGADVHLRSNRGMTPLHYAAAWGNLNVLQYSESIIDVTKRAF